VIEKKIDVRVAIGMKNHFPIFPIGAILKIASASQGSSTLSRDEKRAWFKFFMPPALMKVKKFK